LSTPFQNRLVGTIIVAAAAIIFLPDLLNGEKQRHDQRFNAIPSAPASDNIVKINKFPEQKLAKLPKQTLSDDIAQDEQLKTSTNDMILENNIEKSNLVKKPKVNNITIAAVKKEPTYSPTTATNTPDNNKSSKQQKTKVIEKNAKQSTATSYAWVIQLGSFREQHNVDNLTNLLKKNGYTTFTKPIKTRSGKLIKVFVGPELSKASLSQQLPKLKALTKMQGKIARFKPAQ
jgi:DedD protein